MAKLILALILIVLVMEIASAQREKPGKCPSNSSSGIGICANTCSNDFKCAGRQKCCRTGCGGYSCTEPANNNNNNNKPGRCPPPSIQCFQSVCRSDADCTGNKKCCSGNCLCAAPVFNGK